MEETIIDPKYLKGFNNAYLLVQYKPPLLEQLLNATTENEYNEYLNGMKDGKRTFEQEQSRKRLQELENLKSNIDRDKTLEK